MTPENEGALGPYLRAIRAHKLVVALAVIVSLGAALGYLSLRTDDYQTEAEVLVTPVSPDDTTYIGLPLLSDSGEPTRTIQTAATLIDSSEASDITAKELGGGITSSDVGEAVNVNPKGESNVLEVTATWSDPKIAADMANTFATAALRVRRRLLDAQVGRALERLRAREDALAPETRGTEAASDLARQITALEELDTSGDPTLRISEEASVPGEPIGAPPILVVILALIGGLVLGTATALALRLADREVRDEDEVLGAYPLPVLTRIPLLGRRVLRRAGMAPAVREAFRTLIAQIEVRAPGDRVVMVTSASRNDGKTTSAINLAMALVASGHRVVLIDFDLRKPDVARRLRIDAGPGLAPMLSSDGRLADLLVAAPQLPLLRVATAASTEGDVALLEALLRRLPAILDQAAEIADYVVVDTAPIGEVADAIKVVDHVDQVLLVVRPSNTNRVNLEQARDLLESTGRSPLGYVVLGEKRGGSSRYYAYGSERDRPSRRERVGT
jgi:capsular exopolysaccharide synthesis family protein